MSDIGRLSVRPPIISTKSVSNAPVAIDVPGRQVAVFLDRDGVINSTDGFVNSPEDFDKQMIPASIDAIVKLSQTKTESGQPPKIIIVTNQGGVSAGRMTDEQAQAILARLADKVAEKGGRLDAIYYCPNGKGTPVPLGEIDARKPAPGMLLAAAKDFGPAIDLADSFMVGDMPTDFEAGEAADARVTTVGVETGFASKDAKNPNALKPDMMVKDLHAFADWFAAQQGASSSPPPALQQAFRGGDWLAEEKK